MSSSGSTPAGGTVLSATRTVTAAEMATLFSAPITLISAPGAGRAVLLVAGSRMEFVAGIDGFADFPTPELLYGVAGTKAILASSEIWPAAAPPTNKIMFVEGGTNVAGSFQAVNPTIIDNMAIVLQALGANPDRAGPIVAVTIAAGGLAYVAGDTGTIDTDPLGYTGGATYIVTTVGGGGAVTGLTITGAGNGYSTVSNPLPTTVGGAQPGIGTGLTVNVTAITAADGELVVTLVYQVFDLA